MSVRFPGISEEGVGNPDFAHHVAVEHEQLHGAVELQPAVVPRLSEEDVDGVLLWGQRTKSQQKGWRALFSTCSLAEIQSVNIFPGPQVRFNP